MNIHILNIYSGMVARGAETVVHHLSTYLSKHHHVTLYQGGSPQSPVLYNQVKIPHIRHLDTDPGHSLLSKFQHALYLDSYNRQVASFTRQAMDSFTTNPPDVVIAFNGVRQLQVLKHNQSNSHYKLIYSNQGQFHPSILKLAGYDNLRKLLLQPDAFISLTPPMHDWAIDHSSTKTQCVLIPNGVDLDKFNPDCPPVQIDLPSPLILCVAGLQPYKQVHLLIDAVALLPQASLLVLGDGPLKETLTTLGHRHLPNRFKIMNVPHHSISSYYAAADVFSLPSLPLEAFGVAYLEALATNTPVVAPNDPIRHSIINDAGLYTDVNNAQAYAQALQQALDKNWNQIPYQQAKLYSWEKIGQQYEDLITNI